MRKIWLALPVRIVFDDVWHRCCELLDLLQISGLRECSFGSWRGGSNRTSSLHCSPSRLDWFPPIRHNGYWLMYSLHVITECLCDLLILQHGRHTVLVYWIGQTEWLIGWHFHKCNFAEFTRTDFHNLRLAYGVKSCLIFSLICDIFPTKMRKVYFFAVHRKCSVSNFAFFSFNFLDFSVKYTKCNFSIDTNFHVVPVLQPSSCAVTTVWKLCGNKLV